MNNCETELKIALDKAQYDTLLGVGAVSPVKQTNMYFFSDSQDADTMVRLRLKLGKYVFCYKKLLSFVNGVNVCDEREREVDAETAQDMLSNGISPEVFVRLTGLSSKDKFAFAGELVTYRAAFRYLDTWTLELDKNEYLGQTDYELECECADLELLEQLKKTLLNNFGIDYAFSPSKSKRFAEKYFKVK